jgi:hypothetical protein
MLLYCKYAVIELFAWLCTTMTHVAYCTTQCTQGLLATNEPKVWQFLPQLPYANIDEYTSWKIAIAIFGYDTGMYSREQQRDKQRQTESERERERESHRLCTH